VTEEKFSCVVIGAGAVGLAAAYTLGKRYKDLLVVERNPGFGRETSSRNSEVIHAGIYYPKGTLKARLCVEGNRLLYEHAERHGVAFRKTGKLIVAFTDEDRPELCVLYDKGTGNGAAGLKVLSKKEAALAEPGLSCAGALLSPSTGIIDSHGLMKSFESAIESSGAVIAYGCEVGSIENTGNGYLLDVLDSDGKPMRVRSGIVVNAAGLGSEQVARSAGFDCSKPGYRLYLSRGEYYRVNGIKPWHFRTLIYPTPNLDSLGIHIVIDLNGSIKLGPNAYYIDKAEYAMDERYKKDFYSVGLKYFPDLKEDDLTPDMTGIRPRLQAPGVPFADFGIYDESRNGYPGFINLIGIESPGLTSCLAIARHIDSLL
jgi:L-2-hydroxyglutarate oxidase LhgO